MPVEIEKRVPSIRFARLDLPNDDVVISRSSNRRHLALEHRDRIVEKRSSIGRDLVANLTEGLGARRGEGARNFLLLVGENAHAERARSVYGSERMGVVLEAHHHEGRIEGDRRE